MMLHKTLTELAENFKEKVEHAERRIAEPGIRHYECLNAITARESAEGYRRDCERIMAEVPDRDFDDWGCLHLNQCLRTLFAMRYDSLAHQRCLAEIIEALKHTMPIAA